MGSAVPRDEWGRGGAAPHPCLSPLQGSLCFVQRHLRCSGSMLEDAARSALKGLYSASHCVDDVCSDMGYGAAAWSRTRLALHVFWVGETLQFLLEVLFLECLFQLLEN